MNMTKELDIHIFNTPEDLDDVTFSLNASTFDALQVLTDAIKAVARNGGKSQQARNDLLVMACGALVAEVPEAAIDNFFSRSHLAYDEPAPEDWDDEEDVDDE